MSSGAAVATRSGEARQTNGRRRRWRLLPENRFLGWTPYAWLAFFPTFLIDPIFATTHGTIVWWEWPATLAALIVFLVSYFRGYWLRGRGLLGIVAIHSLLAMLFSPINLGASVFFVYAGSFAAQLPQPRYALRTLILVLLAAATSALLIDAPSYYWISGLFFTALIGGVNIHFAQVGRAQQKLRLAQEQIEHLAAVAERERIARDLHDVLGHTLSLIVLKSELAAKLAERDPARAAREIRDVETVSRQALQEVREAIGGYRATLRDEVLRSQSLLDAAGVIATIQVPAIDLPRALEEALALTLREAITNIVRHSNAERCTITLHEHSGTVTLRIEDDGTGRVVHEGNGLRGIRERAELLGGRMQREGSRITVTLPTIAPATSVTGEQVYA